MRTLLVCIFCGFLLSGCAQLQLLDEKFENYSASQRIERYNNFPDKHLLSNIYLLSQDGKNHGLTEELASESFEFDKITEYSFSVEKKIFSEPNMNLIFNKYNNYNYDSSSDAIANKYIGSVKLRGNRAFLYKPIMGKLINEILRQPFDKTDKTSEWYGLDNAIIEYDSSDRIVSVLVRAHQAVITFGADSRQYSTIYTGSSIRHIENNIPNSIFTDSFIREIRL